MKFAVFDDAVGDKILVNIEAIRTMTGDTDNDGDLTEIAFDGTHRTLVRGDLQTTLAVVADVDGAI